MICLLNGHCSLWVWIFIIFELWVGLGGLGPVGVVVGFCYLRIGSLIVLLDRGCRLFLICYVDDLLILGFGLMGSRVCVSCSIFCVKVLEIVFFVASLACQLLPIVILEFQHPLVIDALKK